MVLGKGKPYCVNDTKMVAHRGASDEAPENSLASIKLGMKFAGACEIDVRLTKDGEVIVCHDKNLERTGFSNEIIDQIISKNLSDLDYSQIKDIDIGRKKSLRWRGEKVPLLSEVLEIIPSGKELLIEIKECEGDIVSKILDIIKMSRVDHFDITFIGFNLVTMIKVKRCFPNNKVFILTASGLDDEANFIVNSHSDLEIILDIARDFNFDGVGLQYSVEQPINEYVQNLHQKNLYSFIWNHSKDDTVDNAVFLRSIGVNYLNSNYSNILSGSLK